MKQFGFSKEERLCSRKLIVEVVQKGTSFLIHPIRVTYLEQELDVTHPAQVLMSVSKRNFKKAVDRNYIKRLMREAYRKNKHVLYESLKSQNKQMAIMLIYIARDLPEYKELEGKIILTLQRLCEEGEKHQKTD